MTYVVTVDTCIPDDSSDLDALGRFGAAVLLERGFGSVAGVEGPGGVEVDVLDVTVAPHARGAELTVTVLAPCLEAAEDAVGAVTQEVLDRAEPLEGWLVVSSEVRLHTDRARESLAAADGPDAPPSDPAARRARHAAARRGRQAGPAVDGTTGHGAGRGDRGAGDGDGIEDGDDEDDVWSDVIEDAPDPETEIRAAAVRLRSFAPEVFGASPDTAQLAAGALVHAAEVLIDELYDDVQALADEDTDVAGCQGHLWHLDRLPARHAARYDEPFARRFLVTAVAFTTRLTGGGFGRLGCLAEELVLRFLLEQARTALDLYGLLDDDVAAALERFHGRVREEAGIGADPGPEPPLLGFGTWFTPFGEDCYVHPYAADTSAEEEAAEEPEGA
ncbi:hypothetical protein [Streptomyces roseicoloratus]|uniref:Aromatic ring-opening dioxygenase LigA n=1 Tax=Streptomyces roseicoloratus TaxID=2508722 RepID=A0ABY9RRL9_9ACTN|nr:hypothetical protein [Streptomyces roseicoloratus]WMX44353.1 hypothetical protein RGF97_05100 [Streptomyces roseicoloratus]